MQYLKYLKRHEDQKNFLGVNKCDFVFLKDLEGFRGDPPITSNCFNIYSQITKTASDPLPHANLDILRTHSTRTSFLDPSRI